MTPSATYVGEECGHTTTVSFLDAIGTNRQQRMGCDECGELQEFFREDIAEDMGLVTHSTDSDANPQSDEDDGFVSAEETLEELPSSDEFRDDLETAVEESEEVEENVLITDDELARATVDLEDMGYRELQQIAGKTDEVAGNQSADDLKEQLRALDDETFLDAVNAALIDE